MDRNQEKEIREVVERFKGEPTLSKYIEKNLERIFREAQK